MCFVIGLLCPEKEMSVYWIHDILRDLLNISQLQRGVLLNLTGQLSVIYAEAGYNNR